MWKACIPGGLHAVSWNMYLVVSLWGFLFLFFLFSSNPPFEGGER